MTTDSTSEGLSLPRDVRESTFVVIAAYNEEACIADVAAEVRAVYPNVVVVDDGSNDRTYEEARRGATHALRHVINRGQGAALQTGIEFALAHNAKYVVTFDADGQHRVEDVAPMLAPITSGECEITLGSRFLGSVQEMPASRKLMLKIAVMFTRIVNRVSVTDAHNGFRAFSSRAARQINITLDRMAHASELIDQIRASRLPFKEVPVRISYTEYSMRKGHASWRGAFKILWQYFVGRALP
ncbi:MAG: glycosyltransferase family 2 protein [Phycisphaerae bacterium]